MYKPSWSREDNTCMEKSSQQTKPDYILRRTEVRDYQALNDAYNRVINRSRTMEQYFWQWVNTPFDTSESWVIEHVASHEIVGHHGVMYLPFAQQGNSVSVGKTENSFVLPGHKGKLFYPGFERIALNEMKDRFTYIFTTASNVSDGAVGLLRKRLGYVPVGKTACFGLSLSQSAIKKLSLRHFPSLFFLAVPLALFHSIVQWTVLLVGYVRARNVCATPLTWESVDEVGAFWRNHRRFYGITPDRTSVYLSWRFAENPHKEYTLVRLTENSKVLGYAVLKEQQIVAGNASLNAIFIDDLIVADADEDNFYLALAALTREYSHMELLLIITLSQDDSLNRAIRRLLGPITRLHAKEGAELLVWGRDVKKTAWYFTSIFSEGGEYSDLYNV